MNVETKERLVAAGTWERYSRLKVKYINEGMATKVAEQKALMEVERPHPASGDPSRRLLLAAPAGAVQSARQRSLYLNTLPPLPLISAIRLYLAVALLVC